jgi:hypothetical protein
LSIIYGAADTQFCLERWMVLARAKGFEVIGCLYLCHPMMDYWDKGDVPEGGDVYEEEILLY